MSPHGMEQHPLSITRQNPVSHKRVLLCTLIAGSMVTSSLLTGCSSISKQTSPQSHFLYDAPAQAYTIDLGAQNFRGGVRLRDSCTPEGSSLNIYDNAGRFFRIDAVNLINNPNIPLPEFADDATTRDLIFRYYMDKVNPGGRIITQRNVNSRMGASLYAVAQYEIAVKDPTQDLNTTRFMGFLITRRGNIGYVIQHEQKFYRSDRMVEILGLLASEMMIPGRLPANRKQDDNPIYIDLKNSTPAQIEEWKKKAQCGTVPTHWLSFGSNDTPQIAADASSDGKAVDTTPTSDAPKPSFFRRMWNSIKPW